MGSHACHIQGVNYGLRGNTVKPHRLAQPQFLQKKTNDRGTLLLLFMNKKPKSTLSAL